MRKLRLQLRNKCGWHSVVYVRDRDNAIDRMLRILQTAAVAHTVGSKRTTTQKNILCVSGHTDSVRTKRACVCVCVSVCSFIACFAFIHTYIDTQAYVCLYGVCAVATVNARIREGAERWAEWENKITNTDPYGGVCVCIIRIILYVFCVGHAVLLFPCKKT